jgi:hypothetical protein
MNNKIGGYLKTPKFIEEGNIYFSILATVNLIKLLAAYKIETREVEKKRKPIKVVKMQHNDN